MSLLSFKTAFRCLCATFFLVASSIKAQVSGTFIQLDRSTAVKSLTDWKTDLGQMKAVGIDTIIVQWTAERDLVYFSTNHTELAFSEWYTAVEKIFLAADNKGFHIYLGLQHDPNYWVEITAREVVLRDYFLVRVGQNARIQKALLQHFSKREDWKGYYIPDEVDDLTWRDTRKRHYMKSYLRHMTRHLHTNDPNRKVLVSTFFRGRTEPHLYASLLQDLMVDSGLDSVLVQDGGWHQQVAAILLSSLFSHTYRGVAANAQTLVRGRGF